MCVIDFLLRLMMTSLKDIQGQILYMEHLLCFSTSVPG